MKENGKKYAERFMYPELYSLSPKLLSSDSNIYVRLKIAETCLNIPNARNDIPGFYHLLCQIGDSLIRIQKFNHEKIINVLSPELVKNMVWFIEFEDMDFQEKVLEIFENLKTEILILMIHKSIFVIIEVYARNLKMSLENMNSKMVNIKILVLNFLFPVLNYFKSDKGQIINIIDSFSNFISLPSLSEKLIMVCLHYIQIFVDNNILLNELKINVIDNITIFLVSSLTPTPVSVLFIGQKKLFARASSIIK